MSARPTPAKSVQQAIQPARFGALQVNDDGALLDGLLSRARDNLTAEDLQALAGADARVSGMLGGIESLCTGLACLILSDGCSSNGEGNFQGADDVPELLELIARIAQHARALTNLADTARCMQVVAREQKGGAA